MSRANGGAYCVAHHQAALDALGGAEVPTSVLAWAARLTREPGAASDSDLEAPRAAGLELEANYTETCQPDL